MRYLSNNLTLAQQRSALRARYAADMLTKRQALFHTLAGATFGAGFALMLLLALLR